MRNQCPSLQTPLSLLSQQCLREKREESRLLKLCSTSGNGPFSDTTWNHQGFLSLVHIELFPIKKKRMLSCSFVSEKQASLREGANCRVVSICSSPEDFMGSMFKAEKIAELFCFLSTACYRGNHTDFLLMLTAVMMCCTIELPGLTDMDQLFEFDGPPACETSVVFIKDLAALSWQEILLYCLLWKCCPGWIIKWIIAMLAMQCYLGFQVPPYDFLSV